jgi:hypothetical protein
MSNYIKVDYQIARLGLDCKKVVIFNCCNTFKKMGLVLLNLGFAILNGFMYYKNNNAKGYKQSAFSAFACGFCLCAALAIFLHYL